MSEFRMPSLGAEMDAGTIVQWLVKPGDPVKRGDIVAVVDTEKAAVEAEIFDTGTVRKIVVEEGQKVPVGTVLALIDSEAGARPAAPTPVATPAAPAAAPTKPPETAKKPPKKAPPPKPRPAGPRMRISPLAMRVAIDLGVDLASVTGSGPHGAITRADVERAANAAPASTAPVPTAPPAEAAPAVVRKPLMAPAERQAAMRKAIAAAMARSKREIPHYYLGTTIDMSRATAWLAAENSKRPIANRLLYSVLLLKAVALAVRDFPEMNGFWVEGGFKPSEAIHLGVAISLRQGGLVAPAIHDVDRKSPDEIMMALRELVKRVRSGVLRSSEIADATLTVTSLGEEGVETVFGIIYPPQVALVGFGKIVERPWAADGMIGARPIVATSLAADHRASDGHRGGLFLAAIDRLLQEPGKL